MEDVTTLDNCRYVVLDEADRMLDMGCAKSRLFLKNWQPGGTYYFGEERIKKKFWVASTLPSLNGEAFIFETIISHQCFPPPQKWGHPP